MKNEHKPYRVIELEAEDYLIEIFQLFKNEWWTSDRSIQETKSLLEKSQLNFGLLDSELKLVGYSRVLTDYSDTAIILDVIIMQELRGHGLGTFLLNSILNNVKMKEVDKIDLHCKENLINFYSSLGFEKKPKSMVWFRRMK